MLYFILLFLPLFAFGNNRQILQQIELEELVQGPKPTFFERYGKRMEAEEASVVVEEMQHDAPAGLILAQGEVNLKDWNERMKTLDQSFYDLHLLYELNLKATRLWKKMVKCASQGAQSAEYARLSYALGSDFCAEWNGHHSSEEIKKELIELHSEVRSYLLTSRILHPKFHYKKARSVVSEEQPESIQEYNQKNYILPRPHPLLVQVILDLFVTHFHFSELYKYPPMRESDDKWEDFFQNILEKGEVRTDIKYQDRERYLSYFLEDFADPKVVYTQDSRYQPSKKLPQADLDRGIILHNSLFLMSHFSVGFCEDWGLWPGLSLAMSFRLDSYHLYFDAHIYPAILLQFKMLASCGLPPENTYIENGRGGIRLKHTSLYQGYHSDQTFHGHSWPLADLHREVIGTLREIAWKYL